MKRQFLRNDAAQLVHRQQRLRALQRFQFAALQVQLQQVDILDRSPGAFLVDGRHADSGAARKGRRFWVIWLRAPLGTRRKGIGRGIGAAEKLRSTLLASERRVDDLNLRVFGECIDSGTPAFRIRFESDNVGFRKNLQRLARKYAVMTTTVDDICRSSALRIKVE